MHNEYELRLVARWDKMRMNGGMKSAQWDEMLKVRLDNLGKEGIH